MQGICKLCGQQKTLRYSHIVPAFAVRWLKETSVTGYLKTLKSKVRVQETRRVHLLCDDCEQILGRDEKTFCEKLFVPYHEKNQQQFEYESWLRKFIVGLHWKVLVTKEETYPAKAEAAYKKAELEWRQFLLGQTKSPGEAEFHLFLSDFIQDSSHELPRKTIWYLTRGLDVTPMYSDAGLAGVYAMVVRTLTFSFINPKVAPDKMIGTQIAESGVLKTPQTIQSSLGSFILGRAKIIDQFPATITPRQKQKLMERARIEPETFLRSESARAFEADRSLKEKMQQRSVERKLMEPMKGRERNSPCPCGSGKKYKKCHGA